MRTEGAASLVVLLTLMSLVLCSCGDGPLFGDPGRLVYVHNATGETVLWYDPGHALSAPGREPSLRIPPGDTKTSNWLVAPSVQGKREIRYTPKAYDESRNLIFCKTYTWEELDNLGWRIEVVKGEISCG